MAFHIRTVAKKTWFSMLRIIFMLAVVVAIAGGILLGTEGGRIQLAQQGVNAINLFFGQRLAVTGIRSPGLGRWRFNKVSIDTSSKIKTITVNELEIFWKWRYVVQNRWWFDKLSAESINVELTNGNASATNSFAQVYKIWDSIPSLRLDTLSVANLHIERPLMAPFDAEVIGQFELNWGALPARFLISLADERDNNEYALKLSADAIDKFRLQGSLQAQPDTAWAQWLKWQMPQPAQANWDLRIDYSQSGMLVTQIDDWTMPWKNDVLKANGRIDYLIDEAEFQFSPLALTLNDQPAQLNGWINETDSELVVSISNWTVTPFTEVLRVTDIDATIDTYLVWRGGWKRPQLQGVVSGSGYWADEPFSLKMVSDGGLNSLKFSDAQLWLSGNYLQLNGGVDWISEEFDVDISGQLTTDTVARKYLPASLLDFSAMADINGRLQGTLEKPLLVLSSKLNGQWRDDPVQARVDFRLTRDQLFIPELSVFSSLIQTDGFLTLNLLTNQWQGDFAIEEIRSDVLSRLAIKLPVDFRGTLSGDIEIEGLGKDYDIAGDINVLGYWQHWPLHAQLDIKSLNQRRLSLADSYLQLGSGGTFASGILNFDSGQIDLNFQHDNWPLSSLPPWLKFWPSLMSSLDGRWTGATGISGYWRKPALQTDSQLIGEWFEEPLSLSLVTSSESADQWVISQLELNWLQSLWHYRGTLEPYNRLNLEGVLDVTNIHSNYIPLLSREFIRNEKNLPEALDVLFRGDFAISGPITSPKLSGNAQATGQLENLPLTVESKISNLDTRHVDIEFAQGQWNDGDWQGTGSYDWTTKEVTAHVETKTPDASHIKPWLALFANERYQDWLAQWQGSLFGELDLSNASGEWQVDANLESDGEFFNESYDVQWQGFGQLSKTLKHKIVGVWGSATAYAEIDSQQESVSGNTSVQGLGFSQTRHLVDVIPPWLEGFVDAEITLEGTWRALAIKAQVATTGQVSRGSKHYPFSSHVNLATDQQQWTLAPSVLDVPEAIELALEGTGIGRQGELQVTGVFPDTRYWINNDEIGPGLAAFNISAQGDLLEPELTGELTWKAERWPISISGKIITQDDKYVLNASLFSQQQTRLKTKLQLGVKDIRLWPETWSSTDLDFAFNANSPLSVLDPFFVDQPDQQLTGLLKSSLVMTGSLEEPRWGGNIQWQDGTFENANYGSLIDNINLQVDAVDSNWSVTGAATDGRRGMVSVVGDIKYLSKPDQLMGHNIDLAFGFGKAQLLNRAEMDAAASGAILASGSYHNLKLKGDLSVSPLNLQSDTFLWDGAPQLNVVAIDETETGYSGRPFYWPKGQWDVELTSTSRANLYGQGINAELSGTLHLSDDLYKPVMSGRFNIVRGTYVGFGKVFQLTDGVIQIQNNQLVINIRGEHSTPSLNVGLHITGTQDSLSLALTSDSNLGEDELLATLLFGKLTEELDVIQAIQLANVINKLRTADSGLDLVAITRDELTLDSLVVDTETDEQGNLGLNISAGKYLNDYLYLEVEQGVGSEQEFRSSLQLQVTPQTYLELYTQGESGDFNNNGVELYWSLDY